MSAKAKIIVKKVTAVLKWPAPITLKLKKAKFIQTKMTGNPNFPLPYPANVTTLVQFGLDITALDTAITNSSSKTKGTSDLVNALINTVHNDLLTIMTMVQNKADSNPAIAEVVIEGAGFDVKKSRSKGKQQNSVKDGADEGSVDLIAEGPGPHEWRMSKDEITWISLESSYTSKTTVSNLTPGDKYFFQNRQLLSRGRKAEWSQSVAIRVR